MKKAISVILTILILLIGLRQAIVVIHFKLNQSSIEQAFCENKNTPEMQCHGNCYLEKELKKPENNKQNPISNLLQKIEILPAIGFNFEVKNRIFETSKKPFSFKYQDYTEPSKEIFIPPPIG
ncbi:MAG: hypothetical protein ACK5NB_12090 [Flavobacteriaceae bacterium]